MDANQGIQAQTVANFYLAFSKNLVIIPVLNKIDLKNANPEAVQKQMKNVFEVDESEVLKVSNILEIKFHTKSQRSLPGCSHLS